MIFIKMDTMNKLNKIVFSAILLLTVSCNGFLSRYPDSAIPEHEAMKTLDDCSQVVLGIYSCFKTPGLYSGSLTLSPDLQSDYVYAVKGFNNTYGGIYRWTTKPSDDDITGPYAILYQAASRCNFFLDYKDQVPVNSDSEKKELDRRLADVYFARALAYADLIRHYCDAYDPKKADSQLGIPLFDKYIGGDEMVLPRSSLKESYEFVLADLDKAEDLMDRDAADSEYFTKGAVFALRARVSLYMHNYKDAIEYAEKVMDNPVYKLADAISVVSVTPQGERLTEYDMMWRYDRSDEIIWKVSMSTTDRGGALGLMFLGFNGKQFFPNFIPGIEVYGKYKPGDGRTGTFFRTVETGYGFESLMLYKYPGNPDIDAGQGSYFTNMPKVLRLSEVYLIHTEACALSEDLKNLEKGNKSLSVLRSYRMQGHVGAGYSTEELLEQVKTERYKELIMEGFRLSDLKRWNLGFKREPQENTLDGSAENRLEIKAGNALFTWPIPQHEIDATGGVVKPNPSNFSN